ncbi:hypothetical protein C8D87_11620 [Lentzea atacamensis]|uniref:TrbL/VirB6 plasmid conjugal transfer protein n=1 Tax=Lentzea atacamensis TaxID=531938 RepID=A0ABX9DV70_9PSEU|nr:hypothetical protein [Lentzea atacamensis]RAS58967.1 hypothetical protein C8D87_11620 [Lentzea atacamensis]
MNTVSTATRPSTTKRRLAWVVLSALAAILSVGVTPAAAEPQPTNPTTTTSPPTTSAPRPSTPPSRETDECGITDVGACVSEGITSFFSALVVGALNPLLQTVGETLLATPRLDQVPQIAELWESSRGIAVASYALLITVAGLVLMTYQTLQTRTTIRETAPRIVVGFLAANLSLLLAGRAVEFANALSYALVADGVEPNAAAQQLAGMFANTVTSAATGGSIFNLLISLGIVVLLVALLGTYAVRVAVTAALVAGAPLFLVLHGLQQTEGIARWWWRAFGGVLAIQVGQSLVLIVGLRVILSDGGFTIFGPTQDNVLNLIVTGALLWILVKIPTWVMQRVQLGGGRSFLGSLIRGFIAYKTFGLIRVGGTRSTPAPGARANQPPTGSPDPYSNVKADGSGQYMLPLPGLRRRPKTASVPPAPRTGGSRKPQGRQLALPFDKGWPSDRPVLTRSGQYRLPIDVPRVTPSSPPTPASPAPAPRRDLGKQLELPFDPYRGVRPTRHGQYVLPLDVARVPKPPVPPAPKQARRTTSRVRQPELPFDPFAGSRPQRDGQYALPLEGVARVAHPPMPKPTPPARRPRSRQLRLPLDLPASAPRGTRPTTGGAS